MSQPEDRPMCGAGESQHNTEGCGHCAEVKASIRTGCDDVVFCSFHPPSITKETKMKKCQQTHTGETVSG